MHYYNEIDPHASAWLRELVAARELPVGRVDSRSIRDVSGDDVRGFRQCHFFAGIGGWPLALRLAGWPDGRPVWTGSCPCPPFSSAGKKKRCPECGGRRPVPCPRRTGYFICIECEHAWHADDRHLWPEFYRIIRQCRPDTIFGEQVSGPDGRIWFAGVRACLERIGYAVGAADLSAAGLGSPHIRQRLFWVAHAQGHDQRWVGERNPGHGWEELSAGGHRSIDGMAHATVERFDRRQDSAGTGWRDGLEDGGPTLGMGDALGLRLDQHQHAGDLGREAGEEPEHGREDGGERPFGPGPTLGLGNAHGDGPQPGPSAAPGTRHGGSALADGGTLGLGHAIGPGRGGCGAGFRGEPRDGPRGEPTAPASHAGPWSRYDIIACRDGKSRRVPEAQSGVLPLVDGLSPGVVRGGDPGLPIDPDGSSEARVARLKGYGNAIDPHLAATFIRAAMESLESEDDDDE